MGLIGAAVGLILRRGGAATAAQAPVGRFRPKSSRRRIAVAKFSG
ncbi:hypothetical protein NK6_4947 [Bradyrhizobium diazoefficiens]|uniref:Uncharacterized protein n=1 Tax=Bradyrhizobium diazoefficiens TaxID=1355477 RepID=A0A0E4FUB4_9BRAD|nr:hypothetical protein NK6_4947 [Bradyrhizobium diazoefficiens]